MERNDSVSSLSGDATASLTVHAVESHFQPTASISADGNMQIAIDSLYPALLQTFLCILLGYGAGRTKIISAEQAAGVGAYVSKFALPALLFQNMATLDWSTVEWTFLASVGLAKLSVFTAVLATGLLVTKPANFATSAICAIFVSQSNDFALGYPIVKAMYGSIHPEFIHYIYLLAPLSLCILNPVAFALIELQKRWRQPVNSSISGPASGSACGAAAAGGGTAEATNSVSCLRICGLTLKGLALNPVLLFTGIGLIANFAFHHNLPAAIHQFVDVLGQSFSGAALFYLGLSIVGKLGADLGRSLFVCCLLITIKLIVFPFVTLEFTRLLNCGIDSNSTADYAMFGFLFGTIPTAPSVFVYASHYAVLPDLVAAAMVLCTIASAPLMFISAIMVSMKFFTLDYVRILRKASFDIALLSVVCTPWVIVMLVLTRRARRMPHALTIGLALCQTLVAVGVLSSRADPAEQVAPVSEIVVLKVAGSWSDCVSFAAFAYGLHGSRVFAALISVTLAAHVRHAGAGGSCSSGRPRSPPPGKSWLLPLAGYVVPLVLVSATMLAAPQATSSLSHGDRVAALARVQVMTQATVLSLCIVTAIAGMILKRRWDLPKDSRQSAYIMAPDGSTRASVAIGEPSRLCDDRSSRGTLPPPANGEPEAECRASLQQQLEANLAWHDEAGAAPRPARAAQAAGQCPVSLSAAAAASDEGSRAGSLSESDVRPPCDSSDDDDGDDNFSDVELSRGGSHEQLLLLPLRPSDSCPAAAGGRTTAAAESSCLTGRERGPHSGISLAKSRCCWRHITAASDSYGNSSGRKDAQQQQQAGRHTALLTLLLLVMLSSVFVSICKLVNVDMIMSGVYVEIVFMDAVLNIGQGFFTFAVFGLDFEFVLRPLWKRVTAAARSLQRLIIMCMIRAKSTNSRMRRS